MVGPPPGPTHASSGLRGQEDWDIQGHTTWKVANHGPPTLKTNPVRDRGRARGGLTGRGRGIPIPDRPVGSRGARARGYPTLPSSSGRGGYAVPNGGGVRGNSPDRGARGFMRGSGATTRASFGRGGRSPSSGEYTRSHPHRDYRRHPDPHEQVSAGWNPPSRPRSQLVDRYPSEGLERQEAPLGPQIGPSRSWSPSRPVIYGLSPSPIPEPLNEEPNRPCASKSFSNQHEEISKQKLIQGSTSHRRNKSLDGQSAAISSGGNAIISKPPDLPPSTEQPIQKMKFKPNKGKRKATDDILDAPTVSAKKAGKGPSGATVKVESEDVKPDLSFLEPKETGDSASGVLSFKRSEIPPDCYAENKLFKANARARFRKEQKVILRKQGRTMAQSHWRDDGVAYDWTTDPVDEVIQAGLLTSSKVTETPRKSTHKLVTSPNTVKQGSMVEPSASAILSAEEMQMNQAGPSKPLKTGKKAKKDPVQETITEIYPWPAHLDEKSKRKQSVAEVNDEKLENKVRAGCSDSMGRLTKDVDMTGLKKGCQAQISQLPLGAQPTFPSTRGPHMKFSQKESISIPTSMRSATSKRSIHELKSWIDQQCVSKCRPDSTGKATRFVAYEMEPQHLILYGRDIEHWASAGSPIAPRDVTPTVAAPEPSSSRSSKRPQPPTPPSPAVSISSKSTYPTKKARTKKQDEVLASPVQSLSSTFIAHIPDLNGVASEFAPPPPSMSSSRLKSLEASIEAKFTAIDNWTTLMNDYPAQAGRVSRQVERTQDEIFKLQQEIKEEKQKLELPH